MRIRLTSNVPDNLEDDSRTHRVAWMNLGWQSGKTLCHIFFDHGGQPLQPHLWQGHVEHGPATCLWCLCSNGTEVTP